MDEGRGLGIGEAAARAGTSVHTLRYYESAGLLVRPPGRDPAGRRRYDDDDLRWIVVVQRLRATGMPVAAVRAYADLCRAGAGNEAQRLELLLAHRETVRAQLEEVGGHLAAIEAKISGYRRSARSVRSA